MNPGILTSGYRPPPMPYGLLGAPSPVPVPDQITHPEAADWAARVITNGGSVSGVTLAAVSNFCRAIDQAGIRDRFMRANLYCGNGLAACLVPLYRSRSPLALPLGNPTDINVNYVSGDYTETGTSGGLGPSGTNSTKYLRTGIDPTGLRLNNTDTHISWYSRAQLTSSGRWAAADNRTGSTRAWEAVFFGQFSAFYYRSGGGSNSGIENVTWSGANRSGHGIAQRSQAGGVLYRNGLNFNVASTVTDANAFDLSTGEFFVGARQLNGTADNFMTGVFQSYSLGLAFTDAQALAYYNALQAFQRALGRHL